eukprot:gene9161-16829_t
MTSPYFSSRPARSAAAKAARALSGLGSVRKTAAKPAAERKQKKREHVKVEYDDVQVKEEVLPDISSEVLQVNNDIKDKVVSPGKRRNSSPKKSDLKKEKLDEDTWEPANWRELLKNIKLMREDETAPVDSQGCERTADESESPQIVRYQILVSLMLSAQTKDQVTFAAMERLKEHGLTIPNIINTKEDKRKAIFIKQATEICRDKYDGDIPDTLEGLLALPGVGPKMGHICMHAAWNKMTGIGVDTHVHRISNRLGWVKKPTKTPEDTRKALEAWLPRLVLFKNCFL